MNGFYEGEDPSYGNDFSDMTGNASETKIRRVSGFIVSLPIMQKSQYSFLIIFRVYDKRKKAAAGTKDRKECRFGNGNGKWRTDTR